MKFAYNNKSEESSLIPPKFLEKKEKFQRTNKNPIASRGTGVYCFVSALDEMLFLVFIHDSEANYKIHKIP